jgi:RNA polymerase sigma factor (sigma-70 family)
MELKQSRFEKLFLPHLDAACNLARLLVGRDQDAQEIAQQAYLRARQGLKEFHGEDPRGWLLMSVRNTAHAWLQKHDPTVFQPGMAIPTPAANQGPCRSPSEERVCQLHDAFNSLSFELREVLVLHEIEGWSYEQLALALSVPVGTIRARLTCARPRLRRESARVEDRELQNEL